MFLQTKQVWNSVEFGILNRFGCKEHKHESEISSEINFKLASSGKLTFKPSLTIAMSNF